MAEPILGIPVEFVPVIASVSAAIVAPLFTAVAGLVMRFGQQTRLAQIEYELKRLDFIQKALAVEAALGEGLAGSSGVEALRAEYLRLVSAVSVTGQAAAKAQAQVQARASRPAPSHAGLASLVLPRPLTIVGWASTVMYYVWAATAVVYLITAIVAGGGDSDLLLGSVAILAASLGFGWFSRTVALRNWNRHAAAPHA